MRHLSLAARLAIGAALILLTQIAVGVGYLLQVDYNRAVERSMSAQRRAVASSVREAEANLAALSQPVLELALDARVRRAVNEQFAQPDQLQEAIRRFMERSGSQFQRILMVNLQGETVIDISRNGESPAGSPDNHANSAWFSGAALASAMRGAGGPVSMTTSSRSDARSVLRNAVFLYNDQGLGVGALMVETSLDRVLQASAVPTLGQRYILDHQNRILISYPSQTDIPVSVQATNNIVVEERVINGNWHILTQAPVRPPAQAALRWHLLDIVPRDQAIAPFRTSMQPLWMLAACGAGISILLIILFSRRLVRPLQQLCRDAELAEADGTRARSVSIIDNAGPEIAAMSNAFHHMHQRITQSYALIEQHAQALQNSQTLLRQREEDLSTTLESLSEALITLDLEGVITRYNPAAESLLGIARSTALGQRLSQVLKFTAEDDVAGGQADDPLAAIAADNGRGTLRLLAANGDHRCWVTARAALVRDRHGHTRGTVVVLSDMSQRRHLEAQLSHAQKMDAVGRLAGGVAHDFNNLLASMMGFAERLAMRLSDRDQRRMLSHIMQAGKRAHTLVDQLLTFSRQGQRQAKLINVGSIVRTACELLRHTGHGNQDIDIEVSGGCWMLGDATQLESSVINLGINALDAMQHRPEGVLRIELSHRHNDDTGRLSDARHGLILLQVSDQGMGMDEATIARACDPFFTTKEPGKGTGLGLASVYGCVEQHGGWMDIHSVPEQGTCITLGFPAHPGPHHVHDTPLTKDLADHARVMLLSSNISVASEVRKACEDNNAHCHIISDVAEALSCYRTNVPQLVLLDESALGGGIVRELLTVFLNHSHASVILIIVEGNRNPENEAGFYEKGVYGIIPKPLRAELLSATIQQALAHYQRWAAASGDTQPP